MLVGGLPRVIAELAGREAGPQLQLVEHLASEAVRLRVAGDRPPASLEADNSMNLVYENPQYLSMGQYLKQVKYFHKWDSRPLTGGGFSSLDKV